MISLIVAMARNRVIGNNQGVPWGGTQKADIKRFRELTENHTIILGRNVYDEFNKPLPNRKHVVVTHHPLKDTNQVLFRTFEESLEIAQSEKGEVFVIGGQQIYELFLPYAKKVYLTEIGAVYNGNTYFPKLDSPWQAESIDCYRADENNKDDYCFTNYVLA